MGIKYFPQYGLGSTRTVPDHNFKTEKEEMAQLLKEYIYNFV